MKDTYFPPGNRGKAEMDPTRMNKAQPAMNPFAGSAPNHGGFIRQVWVECKCCGDTKVIRTEDFRMNWM